MKRRTKGEGSIYQKGERWYAQITLPNGKRRTKSHKTLRIVKEWLVTQRKAAQDGMLGEATNITVDAYLARYIETSKYTLKEKTHYHYSYIINSHIRSEIGRIKLSNLRADHLQDLYARKLDSGLSHRTIRYIHNVLHKALEQAVRWNIIPRNVAKLATPPSLDKRAPNTLSPDQVRILLEQTKDHRYYALFYLAIATGMRQGEILGLRWIDVGPGYIRVSQAAQYLSGKGIRMVEPKTEKSRRLISVPPEVNEVLDQHKINQEIEKMMAREWTESGLVFTTRVGTPIVANHIRDVLKAKLEEAGLPQMRFHDLRHTAATLLLSANVHPKIVQEMLGHSSISLTLDIYSHVNPNMQEEAAAKMGAILRTTLSKDRYQEE